MLLPHHVRAFDRETRVSFMVFPGTRTREAAIELSGVLAQLTAFDDTRHQSCEPAIDCSASIVNWTNVSSCRNILLPREIYIRGWQLSPHAGLVCGARPGKVGLTSLEVIGFRYRGLRLEW
jgi:hypothetical protein